VSAGLLVLLAPSRAEAYPSSVVFVPTAESRRLLQVGGFGYGVLPFGPSIAKPRVGAWFGLQAGIVPSFDAGGVELGGLEAGLDFIVRGSSTIKPVLNAKLSLVRQYGWFPSIAVGFMGFAPAQLSESTNFGYAVLSESIVVGRSKTRLGQLSLGMAYSFAPKVGLDASAAFHGTWPFHVNDRMAPLLGYRSPTWGSFAFGIESFGGYGETSAATAGIFLTPVEWLSFSIGATFTNDRKREYRADGPFLLMALEWDVLQKPAEPLPPPTENRPE